MSSAETQKGDLVDGRGEKNAGKQVHIAVEGLTMAFGDRVIQRDLTFDIYRGDIFIIMGGSGCGKTTLMRHMLGLYEPRKGSVSVNGLVVDGTNPESQEQLLADCGVTYQSGALWSSMTLAENVALPLELHTTLSAGEIRDLVSVKLALVGLAGFDDFYPSEISGGMQKRAGLARALALDPPLLFFDEPSAGLDPISSMRLDELILQLSQSRGVTVVLVTHELPSILSIGSNSVFLDAEAKTMLGYGHPEELRTKSEVPKVRQFLNRE